MSVQDRPLADKGFISYRHITPWGSYVMIGAVDDKDALKEATRSLAPKDVSLCKLEKWNGTSYAPVKV